MPTIKFFPGKGNSRSPHAFAHGQKGKKKKEKRWTFVRRLLTTRLSGNRMKGGGGGEGNRNFGRRIFASARQKCDRVVVK